jgi:predicted short-subunit dehydrogenase-like oxidoreductase (DUF2520 family)
MKVAIIGAGNVATVLGKLIFKHHEVVQVYARDIIKASGLANQINATATDNLNALTKDADLYILAVSDNAVEQTANTLSLNNKIVVHTAGSVSINVLKNTSANYGVLYPLQSLRKENTTNIIIPFLIDASNQVTLDALSSFAKTLSDNLTIADDATRLKLHVAAVIVSNFSNHLYALTEQFCNTESISFNTLLPLISETANRLKNYDPLTMQTGPAVRNDHATIEKHLQLLQGNAQLQYVYQVLSESIIKMYHQK